MYLHFILQQILTFVSHMSATADIPYWADSMVQCLGPIK